MFLKAKKNPRSVFQMNIYVFTFIKNQYCVSWKKNRKNSLLERVRQIEAFFKFVKNKTDEESFGKKNHHTFLKHESTDQLENVFVFQSQTCISQNFA